MSCRCCDAAISGPGSGKLQSSSRVVCWCCFGTWVDLLHLHTEFSWQNSDDYDDCDVMMMMMVTARCKLRLTRMLQFPGP